MAMKVGDYVRIHKGSYPGRLGTIEGVKPKTVLIRLEEPIKQGGRTKQVVLVHKTSIALKDSSDPESSTIESTAVTEGLKEENRRLDEALSAAEELQLRSSKELSESQSQISVSKAKITEQQTKIVKATKAMGHKDAAIEKYRKVIDEAQTLIGEARASAAKAEKENNRLKEELEDTKETISEVSQQLGKENIAVESGTKRKSNDIDSTPTGEATSSEATSATRSARKRQRFTANSPPMTNLHKTKFSKRHGWDEVKRSLEEGGWEMARGSNHMVFRRRIPGFQTQTCTVPCTPSTQNGYKAALGGIKKLDAEMEALREELYDGKS
jgi:myosin heavy subunit